MRQFFKFIVLNVSVRGRQACEKCTTSVISLTALLYMVSSIIRSPLLLYDLEFQEEANRLDGGPLAVLQVMQKSAKIESLKMT